MLDQPRLEDADLGCRIANYDFNHSPSTIKSGPIAVQNYLRILRRWTIERSLLITNPLLKTPDGRHEVIVTSRCAAKPSINSLPPLPSHRHRIRSHAKSSHLNTQARAIFVTFSWKASLSTLKVSSLGVSSSSSNAIISKARAG